MSQRCARDGGFTLIETLVALAIVGMVLTTVYGVFGSGLRAASRDEDRLLLALVAQNLMARSHFDLFPAEGALTGDIGGGLRWRIEGEPYALPEGLLPEAPAAEADDDAFGAERDDAGRGDTGFGRDAGADDAAGSDARNGEEPAGLGEEPSLAEEAEADQQQEREPVRLRLVQVTVEKGAERYELGGLVLEPRRDRGRLP